MSIRTWPCVDLALSLPRSSTDVTSRTWSPSASSSDVYVGSVTSATFTPSS